MKKMLFAVLFLILLFCGINVFAASEADLKYTISERKVIITECKYSASGDLVIPETIDGYPVTEIDKWAFSECNLLTSIEIPYSVRKIDDFAFSLCGSLTSINVSEDNIFYKSIDGVLFSKIDNALLAYPGGLKNDTYTVPDGVTKIVSGAFENCDALKRVEFPDTVTTIGEYAFALCDGLKSIEIPDGVTNIETRAFGDCTSLTNVVLSDNLTVIGECVFFGCYSLTSINIPDSVTTICDGAFACCSGIKSINIPNGVTTIEDGAFSFCENLTSIEIPDSVTTIVVRAFEGCNSLTEINVSEGNTAYESVNGVLFSKANKALLVYPKGLNNSIYSVPEGIITIAGDAFSYCNNLKTINFNEGLINIESYAFYGCSSLTSVTFPVSLKEIGSGAFSDCESLTEVYLTRSVVCSGAFDYGVTKKYINKIVFKLDEEVIHTTYAKPNEYVSFPELPPLPLGYIYYYDVYGGFEGTWDGYVTADTVVDIHVGLREYYITFIGDYSGYKLGYYNTTVTLPTAPYGYSYTFTVGGKKWDGIITSDLTVFVKKIPNKYTITFVGEYEGEVVADYNTTVDLPTAPYGYSYAFTLDSREWDGIVTGDLTVQVSKIPNKYTITYTGAYEGEVVADYGATVDLPTAPYGYTYTFTADGEEWNGKVTGDLMVNVAKIPNKYTITFVGAYTDTVVADYGTTVDLPIAPYGYSYAFTLDGREWDGIVTGDLTVQVSKIPNKYTITFVGEYEGEVVVDYNTTVDLPTAPYGYSYAFTLDGKEWDGYVIADLTVNVVKTINQYTITYTGAYTDTVVADYGTTVDLPIAPYGYTYTFTVDGKEWDGIVTGDLTVTVTRKCDLAEIISIGLDNEKIDGTDITGEWLWQIFAGDFVVSENATYEIFTKENFTNKVDFLLLSSQTEYYIKVTAESGREKVYTLNVTRSVPKTLGTLTIEQISGGNMTLSVENAIKGEPYVVLYFGKTLDLMTNYIGAELDSVNGKIYVKDLPENMECYFKIVAVYDDLITESSTIFAKTGVTLSSECYILRTLMPPGGDITHAETESGTGIVSGLRVINSIDSVTVNVEVSKGATWGLYRTKTSTTEIDKTIDLTNYAGRTITRYIRVKSENGEHERIYSISVYRQSKSQEPSITFENGKVVITSGTGTVLYTTDKSVPSEENENALVYSGPFTATSGTVIKAIVKENGKDEYSNVVMFTVPSEINVTLVPLDIFKSGKEYVYAINIEAQDTVSGTFVIALYDDFGRLVATDIHSVKEETEYCAENVILSNETATNFKAFMWSDLTGFSPMAEMVYGMVD